MKLTTWKWIAVLGCLLFALTLACAGAAEESGNCGDLTWHLDDAGTLTISGTGPMPEFTRTAETYKGYVVGYSYNMPWYNSESRDLIKKIVISSGVTSIGQYSFYSLTQVTSVTMPAGITKIGASAFCYCSNLETVTMPSSGLTQIGASAFERCYALESIDIPSGVTMIPGNAFYGCSSLRHISIPGTVTSFGNNAFGNCTAMEEVLYKCTTFYNSTYGTYADDWTFKTFNGMYSNPMAASKKAILYVNGNRMSEVHLGTDAGSISDWAYCGCQNQFSVVANGGYTGEIGNYAFYDCSNLIEADLPSSVYRVGNYAFANCSQMNYTFMLFDGLTYIGDYAFSGCSSITQVNQTVYSGRALTYIGTYAFYQCTGLTTVKMNASDAQIKNYAFWQCDSLTSITFVKQAPAQIESYAFSYVTANVKYYDGASWTGKVKSYGGTLTWTATGGSCGAEATWKITDDGRLIIAGSGEVTSEAWYNERGMTGLEIGNGITGANVSFSGVTGAMQGTLDGGDYWVLTPAGVLHIFGSTAMPDMTAGHSIWTKTVQDARIHEGVTKIGAHAFDSALCSGMTNIRLPGTLQEIRSGAFAGCAGLTDIYFPDPMPKVNTGAFTGVTANAWYLYSSAPGMINSGTLTWRTYCVWEDGAAVPHTLVCNEAVEPTCEEDGYEEHWSCERCGSIFEDEYAVLILEEEDILREKKGHRWTTEPSFRWEEDGSACEVTFGCLDCEASVGAEVGITSEQGVPPTDTEWGATDYTATAEGPDGETYTNTLRIEDIPPRFTWSGTTIIRYTLEEENVTIPAIATKIGTGAFKDKASLKNVIIPKSVTSIASNAFDGCSEELTILSSDEAYAHTYALNKGLNWVYCAEADALGHGTWGGNVTWILSEDGTLELNGEGEIRDAEYHEGGENDASESDIPWFDLRDSILRAVIHEGITGIGKAAFAECDIRSVSMPSTLKRIGDRAFAHCTNYRVATFPAGLESIGNEVFINYGKNIEITFLGPPPAGLGDEAFAAEHVYGTYRTGAAWDEFIAGYNGDVLNLSAMNGNCGEGMLGWTLGLDGTLRLNGTGTVSSAGWYEYRDLVTAIEIGEGITGIESGVFGGLTGMSRAVFRGEAPAMAPDCFTGITAEAYFPEKYAESWAEAQTAYGGTLTWTAYCRMDGNDIITEHHYVTEEATEATCTEPGWTEGRACDGCGLVVTAREEIPAKGHQYGEPEFELTEDGNGCTAVFSCERGDRTVTLAAEAEMTGEVQPTCTVPGSRTYTATLTISDEITIVDGVEERLPVGTYSKTLTKEIPAAGHKDTISVEAVEATCTEAGHTAEHKCSVCGEVLTESETVPAKGHTPVADPAVAPTCTESGLTEGSHCGVCGAVLEEQKEVPVLKTLWLPEDLTEIGDNAFEGGAFEAVVIPDRCAYVGHEAFKNCEGLIYVSCPADTEIEEDAFRGCEEEIRIIRRED